MKTIFFSLSKPQAKALLRAAVQPLKTQLTAGRKNTREILCLERALKELAIRIGREAEFELPGYLYNEVQKSMGRA